MDIIAPRSAPPQPAGAARWRRRAAWLAVAAALAGAFAGLTWSSAPVLNAVMESIDASGGYRFSNTPLQPGNTDEIFIVLAFSGGGTRAAAFSFGAMEELAKLTFRRGGQEHRLLDEVDIISAVSGGSFPAASYGLKREAFFAEFPEKFLYRNIQASLAGALSNPLNWARLTLTNYDRIDLAADYYDEHLFDHATFGDLARRQTRPFVLINATDMSYVSRFEFTQEQFDLLNSDLSSYPVARAVAASSAFPVLLSPLTLRNYPRSPDRPTPLWIADAMMLGRGSRDYDDARVAQSYSDTTQRPFIHLLDGGLSDNVGLRGPARALMSVDHLWSLVSILNTKARYVVFITVNAGQNATRGWDRKRAAPGVLDVLITATGGPMGNLTQETLRSTEEIRGLFETMRQNQLVREKIAQLEGRPAPKQSSLGFYSAELSFQDLPLSDERAYCNNLPTSFSLPREAVDRLRCAAAQLLRDSPEIKRLLADLER